MVANSSVAGMPFLGHMFFKLDTLLSTALLTVLCVVPASALVAARQNSWPRLLSAQCLTWLHEAANWR